MGRPVVALDNPNEPDKQDDPNTLNSLDLLDDSD